MIWQTIIIVFFHLPLRELPLTIINRFLNIMINFIMDFMIIVSNLMIIINIPFKNILFSSSTSIFYFFS